ncbi:H-NS histone family protein [Janthinobacterium lividum]
MTASELYLSMGKMKVGNKAGKSVAPKYQNPNNNDEKWTGRGRKPAWVKALIDGGATLASLAI